MIPYSSATNDSVGASSYMGGEEMLIYHGWLRKFVFLAWVLIGAVVTASFGSVPARAAQADHTATKAFAPLIHGLPASSHPTPNQGPFPKRPIAPSASAFNPAIINNGTVELGINPEGDLNVCCGSPSSGTGTTTVGLRYMPTNADALAPGCTCEGWGLADSISAVTGSADTAVNGDTNITVQNFTSTSTAATSTVQVGATFQITQTYQPSSNPHLYQINVSVQNISNSTVHALYRRVMDWDVEPTAFHEYVTNQVASPFQVIYDNNDGFATPDPLGPETSGQVPSISTGSFSNVGPMDQGAQFNLDLGTVQPGGSTAITLFYGAAGNQQDALSALASQGATTYSLGQPSTPGGPSFGVPNTFMFGVGGGLRDFKQNSGPWSVNLPGDPTNYLNRDLTCPTISSQGCALTAVADVAYNYGRQTIPGTTTPLDPGSLNGYLHNQGGYSGCGIYWGPAAKALGFKIKYYSGTLQQQISSALDDNNLPIVGILLPKKGLHFIVAYQRVGTDFRILDPWLGSTDLSGMLFSQAYPGVSISEVWVMNRAPIQGALRAPRRIAAPLGAGNTSNASWGLRGDSTAVQLLVTDPQGFQTGYMPSSGMIVQNILDSMYLVEQGIADLGGQNPPLPDTPYFEVDAPLDGIYTIQVIGISSAPYKVDLLSGNDNLSATGTSFTGVASLGSNDTYQISCSAGTCGGVSLQLDAGSDSGVQGDDVTNVNVPTLVGTASAGASVTISDGGTALGTTNADGSGAWSYTVPSALADGLHTIAASVNNGAIVSRLALTIDTAPPTISASAFTADGAQYNTGAWTNQVVTVLFSCADATSGTTACPSPVLVSAEGAGQFASGTVTDLAGNSSSVTFGNINVDTTPPTITASAATGDGKPYAGAWTMQPVTVSFTCSDALSGIASCPSPVTISSDGGGQSVTGTASDTAGNTASAMVGNINIDATPPTITPSETTADNKTYTPGTWANQSVTVHFACYDATSGIASCSPDTTLANDGANQSVVGTATDIAGNTASTTVTGINIDKETAVSPTSGTYKSPITVTVVSGGFTGGERVKLYWDTTTGTPLTTATASSTGSLSASITIPETPFGYHTIIAVGSISGTTHHSSVQANPSLLLGTSSGFPGGLVKATGYSFTTGETVNLNAGSPSGPFLARGVASSLGTVTFSFRLPTHAPGGPHQLYATGQTSGGSASAKFTVLALVSVSPSSGVRGSSATMQGNGYRVGENVTVKWNCNSSSCASTTILATATADSSGSFSSPITIPSAATVGKTYPIGGIGAGGSFASAKYSVTG